MANTLGLIIPFTLLALFMGTVVILAIKSNRRLKSVLASYATEHGWRSGTPHPDIPMFKHLRGYKIADKTFIEGDIGGYHFWFYNFWAGNGGGPGNRFMYYYLSVELPFEPPAVIIEPRSSSKLINAIGDLNTSLEQFNNGLVPFKLEGEADNQLSVMIEGGQETICLQYLTPDFLSVIEQQIKSAVVLSSNFVSINAGVVAAVKNKQALDDLFAGAEALLKTLPVRF